MTLRFQADADLNPEIGLGLRRREASVDFRAAAGVIADGTPDPEVLRIAAGDGRVLVSRDITTMPRHFVQFVAGQESPGILLVPSRRPIGSVIERLLIVWSTWTAEDLQQSNPVASVAVPAGAESNESPFHGPPKSALVKSFGRMLLSRGSRLLGGGLSFGCRRGERPRAASFSAWAAQRR